MNLRLALLEVHSRDQATMIADYVGFDPERFAELIKLFTGPVYRESQRAAWPVRFCFEREPDLVKPYINRLVKLLENEDTNLAVKRNVVRLFQFIDIPKRYACYKLVDDPKETAAVRVFAMTVAANVAKDSPELLAELRLVATKHPQAATAGFRSRARRILGV